MSTKPVYIFARAQASAFTGGITDYLVMLVCTELLTIHYTVSIVLGGIIGAIVNFSVNRHWSFQSRQATVQRQLSKFITVVAGSILLKSSGTYFFTNWLSVDYKVSRVVIDIIVSLGFNFTLQKYWVFSKKGDPKVIFADQN